MSARTRLFAGPVHGPTHRSAPTESIEIPVNPRRAGGDRAPPLPVDRGAQQRADVPKAWLPRPNFVPKFGASVIGIGPYENTKRRRSRHDRPGQWRRVKRLRRGCKERVGITAEIIPKVSSNLGQSLSRPLGDSSLYTREPFPAGDGRTPPGHWDSQQRQTGRDRARPLQKGGEYAEG